MGKKDYRFFFPFRVRYSETDGQGIVFNANYLNYFDTAVYEYLRSLPFDYVGYVKQSGHDFHTVHVGVDFMSPARFDTEIETYVKTANIGRSSLKFDLAIFPKHKEKLLVKADMVWVHTDQYTHRSSTLPEQLIARINHLESVI